MPKDFYTNKGFSLVESLVAITVLLVAIVGPMTIASQGLQASFFSREQTTAVYLAQESIESIEKMRTNKALSGLNDLTPGQWTLCQNGITPPGVSCDAVNSWDWFNVDINPDCSNENVGCDLDTVNDEYRSCTGNSCNLLFDGNSYQYDSGDVSQFTRVIHLEEVEPDQEVEVTVTVSWQANLFGGTSEAVLQTRILNQYE